jgi:MarR family transcriptional regulator, 2-MHQ and catechol-resistance regulon repressor
MFVDGPCEGSLKGEDGRRVKAWRVKTPSRLLIPDDHVAFWTNLFPDLTDATAMRAFFALRSLAKQVNDAASEWLEPFGLTSAKYNYLVVLYVEQRPLTFSEIKSGIHTTGASVTGMIRALELDGLVERTQNPEDARSAFVGLTRKGRNVVERVFPEHHRFIDEAVSGISKARIDELLQTLLAVGAGFEAARSRRAATPITKKAIRRRSG